MKKESLIYAFKSVSEDIIKACKELEISPEKEFTKDETIKVFSLVEKYDLERRVIRLQEREHFLMLKSV